MINATQVVFVGHYEIWWNIFRSPRGVLLYCVYLPLYHIGRQRPPVSGKTFHSVEDIPWMQRPTNRTPKNLSTARFLEIPEPSVGVSRLRLQMKALHLQCLPIRDSTIVIVPIYSPRWTPPIWEGGILLSKFRWPPVRANPAIVDRAFDFIPTETWTVSVCILKLTLRQINVFRTEQSSNKLAS